MRLTEKVVEDHRAIELGSDWMRDQSIGRGVLGSHRKEARRGKVVERK
jgi:hypothetical protein